KLAEMGVKGEEVPFSLLSTALNYEEIATYLRMEDPSDPDQALQTADQERLEQLSSWIFERKLDDPKRPGRKRTQLGESRSFRHLAAILQSEAATEHLLAGASVEEAEQYTALPAEAFTTALSRASNELRAANEHLHEVERPSD